MIDNVVHAAPTLAARRLARRLTELPWWLLRLSNAGNGRATGTLRLWLWWEALTGWRQGLRPVRHGGLTRFTVARHRGRPVRLQDRTLVVSGDAVLDLHIDNRALVATNGEGPYGAWHRLREATLDLRCLANRLDADPRRVRALHAVTLLEDAGKRLGFEVRPLPRTWNWSIVRYFFLGLEAVYHRTGLRRLDRPRSGRWPAELWMSVPTLQRLYGTEARPRVNGVSRVRSTEQYTTASTPSRELSARR